MMPLEREMIGLYLAVGNANHMPPWGGVELLLSTNPIAVAIPALEEPPLVLDMATSVAAYGKVKTTAQRGEQMPEGWMIDASGNPLTDPKRAEEGFLLPIGGYKGYGLALVVGISSGLAMGLVPLFGSIARPYLLALIALPMIGILPLIQAIFGIGVSARVVVVFVVAFLYVALNSEVGARSIRPELREMAHSFGASRWQMMRYVILPQAFPSIMAGTRLGLQRAISGMVLAELFLSGVGIGSLLSFHRNRLDAGAVFAIALTMVLEGVILLGAARWLERRVTRGYVA